MTAETPPVPPWNAMTDQDRAERKKPQGPIMRTGRTLRKESPFTGGLVTLYRVTPGDGPDVCVGAVPAAEADMIVPAVNEYFARFDGERVAVLRQALWDCWGAAGGDRDGERDCPPPGVLAPDVHVRAVEAVRELRRDYDAEIQVTFAGGTPTGSSVSREDLTAILSLVRGTANTAYVAGPVFGRLSAAAGLGE